MATIFEDAEQEFIKFVRFTLKDKILTQEEKKNLLNEADTLKIDRARAEEIISSEMKKAGAIYKVEKTSSAPESFPDYYAILEIEQTANNTEIGEAYKKQYSIWNSRATNPKFRDDVSRMKKLLQDARDTLLDPYKRKEYDRQLKESRENPVSPTGQGTPRLEIDKTSFEISNMQHGSTASRTFSINNTGGGILSGSIKSNKKWLKVSQSNIDTSRHRQEISFQVDITTLDYGVKDTGIIEIQSNGGVERIPVSISIEEDKEAIKRFRSGLTVAAIPLGALFGFFIYNLNFVQGMNENVAGIAGSIALIGAVIFGAKLGYELYELGYEIGTVFGGGFGTFIAEVIILVILNDYFPTLFSTAVWALIYGVVANVSAKSIWKARRRGDKKIPIIIGSGVAALSILVVIGGMEIAKKSINISSPKAESPSKIPPSSSQKNISRQSKSAAAHPPEPQRHKELTGIVVSIDSSPSGAAVLIDKKPVGTTPLRLALKAGSHGLSIEKAGYKTVGDIIEVNNGGQKDFHFSLEAE